MDEHFERKYGMSPARPEPRWRSALIDLQTVNGPKTVTAEVFGPLAVHAILKHPAHFTVSHARCGQNVGFAFPSEEAAKRVAEAMLPLCPSGWAVKKPSRQFLRMVSPAVVNLCRENNGVRIGDLP